MRQQEDTAGVQVLWKMVAFPLFQIYSYRDNSHYIVFRARVRTRGIRIITFLEPSFHKNCITEATKKKQKKTSQSNNPPIFLQPTGTGNRAGNVMIMELVEIWEI